MNKAPAMGNSTIHTDQFFRNQAFIDQVNMAGPGLTVVINGKDTSILFANSLFEEYTGYPQSALEGMSFTSMIEPNYHSRVYAHLAEVRGQSPLHTGFVIYHLRNGQGQFRPFYAYASALVSGKNENVFRLFLLPDSSKWGMPFTSFETRELFLELFEAENFGTFEWMIGSEKVFWSDGVYRIYEIEQDGTDLTRSYVSRFIHPLDEKNVREGNAKALVDYSDVRLEYRIITGRKNIKTIQSLARVIRDSNGDAVKFVGSIRDVTAQRNIENNLKNKVEELHRSNRELEEFAYAASHDMLEPLRKITTFSDRLSEKYKFELVGDGAMYLSRVVASAENMRQLINGLLEFSKISQTSGTFEDVDLNSVILEVMNNWELKIEETGTAIRCIGLPVIEAVPSQMKQLFMNLIGNAIKFHKPGIPPIIKIDVTDIQEDELLQHQLQPVKKYYKIQVSDNGIGFEDQYAGRIFQVFQRLHGKSEYPGSGIGLAICKKILEYHNGVIYAENAEGSGARFVFIIPAKQ